MVVTWKPDTCKCIIIYDKEGNVLESYKNKKTHKCDFHKELDTKTELYPFVISENQSSNRFYVKFTDEEMEKPEIKRLIIEYKKVFVEVPDLDLILEKTLKESITLFRG